MTLHEILDLSPGAAHTATAAALNWLMASRPTLSIEEIGEILDQGPQALREELEGLRSLENTERPDVYLEELEGLAGALELLEVAQLGSAVGC